MTLAKGLTGAAIAARRGRAVARKSPHVSRTKCCSTGLTYCGHPLACAAGLAAIEAYADEGPDRALARAWVRHCWRELERLAETACGHRRRARRSRLVRRARAGRRPRNARAARALAADAARRSRALLQAAMAEGVSFGARGNLLLIAPPLVIDGARAGATRSPCSIGCWQRFFPADSITEARIMSFRLTYATMFDPPEAMHERFEAALAAVSHGSGAARPVHRRRRRARLHATSSVAARSTATCVSASSRSPSRDRCEAAMQAAHVHFRAGAARRVAERARLMRRVADIMEAARLRDRGGAGARGRQEPHGGAGRSAGDASISSGYYADDFEQHDGYEHELPNDPLPGMRLAQPQRHAAVRRLGGHRAVQFSAGARRRTRPPRRWSPATLSS